MLGYRKAVLVLCILRCLSIVNALDFSGQSGWSSSRGWKKLKERIPSHENSSSYTGDYGA
jgi:hypothetical protein